MSHSVLMNQWYHILGASLTGIPCHLHIYEGKPIEKTEDTLGSRVVKRALAVCNNRQDHSMFFGNFFSSYKLMLQLGEMGFRATGTIQNDRIDKCPLVLINNMKKKDRVIGVIGSWNKNSVVPVRSNAYGLLPLGQVKTWKKRQGNINVEQPAVNVHYNCGMGGVDLADRALSDYRPSIHCKKWHWPLVVNALNVAFVYCWCFTAYQLGKPKNRNCINMRL